MKKGVVLSIFLGTLLINFVSAAPYFSLSSLLDAIGPSTMVLGALFIIFLAILHNVIFINFFKGKTGLSAIVSFCISLLAVYGLNKARWDISGFFYGLGISEALFAILIPLIILIGAIILIKKLGFPGFLMIFGALLFFSGVLGFVYEKAIVSIVGTILFLIGLWWWKKRRNKLLTGGYPPSSGGGYGQQQGPAGPQGPQGPPGTTIKAARSINDLKQKYLHYLFLYHRKGLTSHKRTRIQQAMYAILRLARKQGVSESDFLSNRYAGTNAKHPSALSSP